MERVVLLNKNNPPIPPLQKGGEEGLFTKVGRGVITDKKGISLVEVMIALVVLLLVSLALMQTAMVSIDANMKNVLRDEAVGIAEMRMNEARNLPFTSTVDNLISDAGSLAGADCPTGFPATGVLIQRNLRNVTNLDFCTNRTVTLFGTDTKRIDITVGWRWRGENYTHSISTIRKIQ
jgi:type II secretory pathway pseudopilin PulG